MPEFLSPNDEYEDRQERQDSDQIAPSALAVLNQSEHAAMVQTANLPANRRKLAEFDSKLMAYANHSQSIALSMFYSLPRAGKQVIGPSVRFAEIVAPCWRNCAVASRVIGDAANAVTAQGVFIDYEANLRNSIEVPRRITDKNGNRFSDDMIITTSNAGMSVARRNAVLKGGVPQALWTPSYEAAQLTAVGKAASHAQRVNDAIEYLNKIGVTEWQILASVGVPSIRELETEHLVTLRVLCQEIKRGDKTIEEVFGSGYDKEIDSLFGQLKMNQAQQTMLRNTYLGRAEALVMYLRDRLGKTAAPAQAAAPTQAAPAQTAAPAQAQQAAPQQAPRQAAPLPVETKTYSDGTTATGAAPLPHQSPAQQEQSEARNRGDSIRDDSAFGGNAGATGTLIPDDPAPGGLTAAELFNAPKPEAPRRRGRPSREEMARRQAGQSIAGAAEPQEPLSEEEERQNAESILEQTDQFAF